jgi:hypothetical protein
LYVQFDPAEQRGGGMLGVIASSSFFVPQVNLPGSMASFVPPAMPIQAINTNGGKTTQQLLRVIRPRGMRMRGLGQDAGAPAFPLPAVYIPPPGAPPPWWYADIVVPWEHNPFKGKSKAEILAAIGDNVPAPTVPASVPTASVPAGARVPVPTVPTVPAPTVPSATATGGISLLPILFDWRIGLVVR